MPSPIASFGYYINDLTVEFTNLSLNVDSGTTYAWDFGDGNSSVLENPTNLYLTNAFYIIKLTVTNPEGTSEIQTTINLTQNPNPAIMSNISAMIDLYSPDSIVGTIKNHDQKEFLITKWQIYLQPLVFNPEVSVDNTHNEYAWPPLVNALIAKLVVIDIINMDSTSLLLSLANNAENKAEQGEENQASGAIKSIETGPTKVERYDRFNSSEQLSYLAKAYQTILQPGGVLNQLVQSACQDAQRVSIYLPMCGPLPNQIRPLKIAKDCVPPKYNSNPFGITERMT